jgi:hypothetical protein
MLIEFKMVMYPSYKKKKQKILVTFLTAAIRLPILKAYTRVTVIENLQVKGLPRSISVCA